MAIITGKLDDDNVRSKVQLNYVKLSYHIIYAVHQLIV